MIIGKRCCTETTQDRCRGESLKDISVFIGTRKRYDDLQMRCIASLYAADETCPDLSPMLHCKVRIEPSKVSEWSPRVGCHWSGNCRHRSGGGGIIHRQRRKRMCRTRNTIKSITAFHTSCINEWKEAYINFKGSRVYKYLDDANGRSTFKLPWDRGSTLKWRRCITWWHLFMI